MAEFPKYAGEYWRVSPLNYSSDVRPDRVGPVTLCDVTLREGGVQAGVKFTIDEQAGLFRMLDDIGIPMIGLPLTSRADQLYDYTRTVKDLGLAAALVGSVHPFYEWKTRGADWKDVVDAQIDGGADVIEMIYFLTDWRLNGSVYQRRMTPHQIIDEMDVNVAYVRQRGAVPFVVVTDTARVEIGLVKTAYAAHVAAGAGMVAVNDSFGAMIPSSMKHLVSEVKEATDGALVKIHCHNDLGLALANSLAGVEAGADIVDGSLNGYGDRGFADLVAIAVNLKINYGAELGVDMARLYELSKVAEQMTGMPIAPSWPLVGDYAFATSAELHHHAMEDDYWSSNVLDTRLFGKQPTFSLTAMSGPIAVRRKLETLGLSVDDETLASIVEVIREADVGGKGILSDEDVRRIVEQVAVGDADG